MKFDIGILYEKLREGDLRENRFVDSHTLTKGVSEFLLLLSMALGRFW
jgi:hypothetical protein